MWSRLAESESSGASAHPMSSRSRSSPSDSANGNAMEERSQRWPCVPDIMAM